MLLQHNELKKLMNEDINGSKKSKVVKIEIPFRTYAKLFFALAIAFLIIKLSYHILLLFISMIIAMTLSLAKKYLVRKGWREHLAIVLIVIVYVSIILSITIFILPKVVGQLMDIFDLVSLIKYQLSTLPFAMTIERHMGAFFLDATDLMNGVRYYVTEIGKQTVGGIFDFAFLFIASIFMFIDGSRSYQWLSSHFSESIKNKLDKTVKEIDPIVTAYVFGQSIFSTLAALVVYISASLLHIPGALTLAVLAAIFDILPVIGFIAIAVISALLGFAVSTKAAITILIVHILYHFFEFYILTPTIYGTRMKLSPLVVLLSILLGGSIAGVPGMVAMLPIVAAYSPVERLWTEGGVKLGAKKEELE